MDYDDEDIYAKVRDEDYSEHNHECDNCGLIKSCFKKHCKLDDITDYCSDCEDYE